MKVFAYVLKEIYSEHFRTPLKTSVRESARFGTICTI